MLRINSFSSAVWANTWDIADLTFIAIKQNQSGSDQQKVLFWTLAWLVLQLQKWHYKTFGDDKNIKQLITHICSTIFVFEQTNKKLLFLK